MAEFYGNGLENSGSRGIGGFGCQRDLFDKSVLEKSLENLQRGADAILEKAMEFAKAGRIEDRDKIEERINAYALLTSIIPNGFDEQKVEDVRNNFKYSVLVDKFQKRLKRRIFG
ncbi:hypothetical protein KY309_02940 [Candidatus Woesearchaeota archaeon]|nr:hypothetical protein [Candidatus Woesearchaeota archaeon]MBW3016542.1 hypothetical protein [Candidatus Woesearchaeota archaeon]